MYKLGALALVVLPLLAQADPIPATPPTTNEGAKCTITWTPDTTGVWKKMNIELMTGPNAPMVHLKTVATLDGTNPAVTSFTYPCPQVEPNSAIYFYQFSTAAAPTSLQWTTRFAIADATGKTVPPPNAIQPDGQAIGWGIGRLVNAAEADPLPSYLQGNGETSQAEGGANPAPPSGSSAAPSSIAPSSVAPVSSAPASSIISLSASPSSIAPISSGMASVPVSQSKTISSTAPSSSPSSNGAAGKSTSVFLAGLVAFGALITNW
jgi:hypothetical protein